MNKSKIKTILSAGVIGLLGIVLVVLVVSDIQKTDLKRSEKTGIAMGTVITQTLYSASDASKTHAEIEDTVNNLEKLISYRLDTSYTYALNKNAFVDCSEDIKNLFTVCSDLYKKSGGAFDITIGKLTTLWNIGDENAAVPSKKEIKNALKYVDGSEMYMEENSVYIKSGQLVDLGAVGKGYALDKVRDCLIGTNTYAAVVCVGGSVLLYGKNPEKDSWTVAVRDPRGEQSDTLGTMTLGECSISTSGDYEKVLEKDGKSYHHILSTKTGYPCDSGLISVTVVCDNGLLSDGLSTACFALGKKEGMKLLKQYSAEGIFVEENMNVTVTEGLRKSFTLTNGKYNLTEK